MSFKPVIPRRRGEQDIERAISYYLNEGAGRAALGFIDSLESTYAHISRHPASGSSRYA